MSVKPSDFSGQGRNIGRNILGEVATFAFLNFDLEERERGP
jgi:hypothetical protein